MTTKPLTTALALMLAFSFTAQTSLGKASSTTDAPAAYAHVHGTEEEPDSVNMLIPEYDFSQDDPEQISFLPKGTKITYKVYGANNELLDQGTSTDGLHMSSPTLAGMLEESNFLVRVGNTMYYRKAAN